MKEEKKNTTQIDRWEEDLAISRMIDEGNPQNSDLEFIEPRWDKAESLKASKVEFSIAPK